MPSLLELQRAVAAGVRSGDFAEAAPHVVSDAIFARDRLAIYRNTARVGVTEALRGAFPVIAALTGEAFFAMAAARLFEAEPPVSACLADYGEGFGGFLDTLPEAAGVPYLGDVARFEWAMGRAGTAADAPRLPASALTAIPPERHATLRLHPHPSVRLLAARYPVDRIADAVLAEDDAAMAAIDLGEGPIHLQIDRGADGLRAERVDVATFAVLERLVAARPLAEVLESGPDIAAPIIARQFFAGRISGLTT